MTSSMGGGSHLGEVSFPEETIRESLSFFFGWGQNDQANRCPIQLPKTELNHFLQMFILFHSLFVLHSIALCLGQAVQYTYKQICPAHFAQAKLYSTFAYKQSYRSQWKVKVRSVLYKLLHSRADLWGYIIVQIKFKKLKLNSSDKISCLNMHKSLQSGISPPRSGISLAATHYRCSIKVISDAYPSLFLCRNPDFSVPYCLLPLCWWILYPLPEFFLLRFS